MITKTEAIVLRAIKYEDNRLIVDMITLDMGRRSFIVSQPRTNRSRIGKYLFQPLTMLQVECLISLNRELGRLKDASISQAYSSIPFNPEKIALSMFLSEVLCHAIHGAECDRAMFSWLRESLLWLDGARENFANFHIAFLLRLLRFLGYYGQTIPSYDVSLNLSRQERNELLDKILLCYKEYIPNFPTLQSLPILRSLHP